MERKQLLYFKRVAELEHITKAAEQLQISQPFLSRSISALEDELGVRLFDHVGRRIVLNPCGKAFYNRAVRILNEAEDAKKEVQDIFNCQQSRLTAVTNVGLYMPGLMKLLLTSRPELTIRQLSAKRRRIIQMLMNGEADFAVCCPPLEENVEMSTVHLRFEPGVIVYPEGHWLEGRDEISLEELKDEAFISVAQGFGTRDALEEYLQKYDFSLKITIETGDTGSVIKFVKSGLGIAILPLSIVLDDGSLGDRYTYIKGGAGADVALTWRRSKYMSDMNRFFVEKAREYFGGLGAFVRIAAPRGLPE